MTRAPPPGQRDRAMKTRKKSDLPEKLCAQCARPFTWRRKWARDWPSVRYCSERCRRLARRGAAPALPATRPR
ncbi:zinc finger protein [Limimaricola hongkongensis DSM 17492]|uniref:Zinc finger protein n=2 Tax=Limimaricola hongkongensis TaxID=278132 RepID=A0A017HCR5_9RHOB|nr:zinc finger protein [Limimaricola hongkongensis DSM 17492]